MLLTSQSTRISVEGCADYIEIENNKATTIETIKSQLGNNATWLKLNCLQLFRFWFHNKHVLSFYWWGMKRQKEGTLWCNFSRPFNNIKMFEKRTKTKYVHNSHEDNKFYFFAFGWWPVWCRLGAGIFCGREFFVIFKKRLTVNLGIFIWSFYTSNY